MLGFTKGLLKGIIMIILVIIVTSAAFLAGFGAGGLFAAPISHLSVISASPVSTPSSGEGPELEKQFGVFWEAWHILERDFYGDLSDPQQITYGAIRGMLRTLHDEHTAFIDPQYAAILKSDISGSFEGIGTTVHMDEIGRLVIVQPFEGQPAAKAGLRKGDIILKVDDTSIENMSIFEAIGLIRGPEGSTIRLTILRKGMKEPFEVAIVRQKIDIPIIESRMLEGDIAYLRLTDFNSQATEKLKEALSDLLERKPKGLIFDLRSNPGGFLHIAVEVTSQFIKEGSTVLIERTKGDGEKVFSAQGGGLALDIPLLVLVNSGSASASEIVAGAIQDHGRGILIGERTFGKGSVQLSHTLSDSSELRVTVARWFTPDGHQIHNQGLTPDIVVEVTPEELEEGLDPQLERAIEYFRSEK